MYDNTVFRCRTFNSRHNNMTDVQGFENFWENGCSFTLNLGCWRKQTKICSRKMADFTNTVLYIQKKVDIFMIMSIWLNLHKYFLCKTRIVFSNTLITSVFYFLEDLANFFSRWHFFFKKTPQKVFSDYKNVHYSKITQYFVRNAFSFGMYSSLRCKILYNFP